MAKNSDPNFEWEKVDHNRITLIEGDIPVLNLPEKVFKVIEAWLNHKYEHEPGKKALTDIWPETSTLKEHNGWPAKFCIPRQDRYVGEELVAARFLLDSKQQFVVIQQQGGNSFCKGIPTVISIRSQTAKKYFEEGVMQVQYWCAWGKRGMKLDHEVARIIGPKNSDVSASSSSSSSTFGDNLSDQNFSPLNQSDSADKKVESTSSSVGEARQLRRELFPRMIPTSSRKRAMEEDRQDDIWNQSLVRPKASKLDKTLLRLSARGGEDDTLHADNDVTILDGDALGANISFSKQRATPPKLGTDSCEMISRTQAKGTLPVHPNRQKITTPASEDASSTDNVDLFADAMAGDNESDVTESFQRQPIDNARPKIFFHFKPSLNGPPRECLFEDVKSPVIFAQHASCARVLRKGSTFLSVQIGDIQENVMTTYDPDWQWITQTAEKLRLSSNKDVIIIVTPGVL